MNVVLPLVFLINIFHIVKLLVNQVLAFDVINVTFLVLILKARGESHSFRQHVKLSEVAACGLWPVGMGMELVKSPVLNETARECGWL